MPRRRTRCPWAACCLLLASGCALPASRPQYAEVAQTLRSGGQDAAPPGTMSPDDPAAGAFEASSLAIATPPEVAGPTPIDAYIRLALAENRGVQAARYNVDAVRARIPQVTALDDPTASNTIYPIPSVAPQYSLMGYNPYNLMLAQQFPWFGTLRVRGQAAEQDVKVALAELAAAELEAVAAVKRAYFDLYFNQRAEAILGENRRTATEIVESARERFKTGGASRQDVLRSEVVVDDLDRELIRARQGLASARADLAREIHVSPEADLKTAPGLAIDDVPAEVDRLYRLAIVARPELRGRLAAIARDERGVELALKKYRPDVTVGLSYMDMEKTNAVTPRSASGSPNVGLFVGFNLPIYQKKLAAGVCEAQSRALADVKLYEAERDAAYREIKDAIAQARSQRDIIDLFRSRILPKGRQALEAATTDYQAGTVDYVTLVTAWREVLQVELQVAQVESDLGKSLATLERAVGCQLNQHPPAPEAAPPPSPEAGPFRVKASPSASRPSNSAGP